MLKHAGVAGIGVVVAMLIAGGGSARALEGTDASAGPVEDAKEVVVQIQIGTEPAGVFNHCFHHHPGDHFQRQHHFHTSHDFSNNASSFYSFTDDAHIC